MKYTDCYPSGRWPRVLPILPLAALGALVGCAVGDIEHPDAPADEALHIEASDPYLDPIDEDFVPLSLEEARWVAESAGLEIDRVVHEGQVPFDGDGDGDFAMVWGFTELTDAQDLLTTFVDPGTAEILARVEPHEGLRDFLTQIGADDPEARGTTPNTYESFPWGWKMPFKSSTGVMTRGYNRATHSGSIYYSTDWDPGNCGHDVFAPASGWVMNTARLGSWGNQIVIAGQCVGGCSNGGWGQRYLVRLAHFQAVPLVRPGWWVAQGRHVSDMGTTGNSTGCHIHQTVYRGRYTGNGNISGSSLPIDDWPSAGSSVCNGAIANRNFWDAAYDYVSVNGSGCP